MIRYSLKGNIMRWGEMVVWLRKNYGAGQEWTGRVKEPVLLKKKYQWAQGMHVESKRSDIAGHGEDAFAWPCFWIPESGPVHTAFVLRWA